MHVVMMQVVNVCVCVLKPVGGVRLSVWLIG